ncbi:MAG: lanthionine synthetase C family protein [Bacteroidales bacterium]|jgi:lantibiotic modifying enzyme|nr:lanthionine synthetase C family protein [Bacteroidales bacterium]
MGWKFFLPDRYIAPVEMKIHEIAGSLVDRVPGEGGLIGGKAGVACFYAAYDHWNGTSEYEGLVYRWIERSLNPPSGHFPDLRFSSGLAGIAWIVHHLSETGLLKCDVDGIFEHLDDCLYDFMISEIKAGHYDYLHGALGIALYFLRQPHNEKYRQYLAELVSELEKIADNDKENTIKWVSPANESSRKIVYNLGLSHGMSSIVLVLAKIYEAGIANEKCSSLIVRSLEYILKQKLPTAEYNSYYPSLALESMDSFSSSRLAWCYGDLGPGLAFLNGGKVLDLSSYSLHGQDVLLATCRRKDQHENKVFDAGICHGSSGLALMYNILYQQTKLTSFRDAALYWLDVTLNKAFHGDGIAGYKSWYHPEYGGWKCSAGLLDGAAGIGLSLLSFVQEDEPTWSRSLLLS